MVNATPQPQYLPGKTRYPLYRRLGGPQGRSGRVRKILPPTGIRPPDRPAHSESLYRSPHHAMHCYAGHWALVATWNKFWDKFLILYTYHPDTILYIYAKKDVRTAFFWVITQRVVVIYYRYFGTTYRSYLQWTRPLDSWPLRMGR